MSPIQALIDSELGKRFTDPKEPSARRRSDAASFGTALDQYLVLAPEAFAAETARRQDEKKAAARPSETRIKVYGMGLIFQKLLGSCEIPTTARQRAAFDAKLAALAPEMAPVMEEIQGKLQPTFAEAGRRTLRRVPRPVGGPAAHRRLLDPDARGLRRVHGCPRGRQVGGQVGAKPARRRCPAPSSEPRPSPSLPEKPVMKRPSPARSCLFGLLAGLVASGRGTPQRLQERPLFESLNGWQVERAASVTGSNACVIVRSYVDEDDDDADNSITFALENKALVVVLTYSKWQHDKDEKIVAATELGGKTVNAKSTWTGNGTQLVGTLPASLVEKAAESEEIAPQGQGLEGGLRPERRLRGLRGDEALQCRRGAEAAHLTPQIRQAPSSAVFSASVKTRGAGSGSACRARSPGRTCRRGRAPRRG